MDAHGEAVALHAAGRVDGVTQEAVAGTLHAYHPGVRATAVHTYRSGMHAVQARSQTWALHVRLHVRALYVQGVPVLILMMSGDYQVLSLRLLPSGNLKALTDEARSYLF